MNMQVTSLISTPLMYCGMAHDMERAELESVVDAIFERSDDRIHAIMHEICKRLVIIDNDSISYNSNRGTTINEEATTHHDPDHQSR